MDVHTFIGVIASLLSIPSSVGLNLEHVLSILSYSNSLALIVSVMIEFFSCPLVIVLLIEVMKNPQYKSSVIVAFITKADVFVVMI